MIDGDGVIAGISSLAASAVLMFGLYKFSDKKVQDLETRTENKIRLQKKAVEDNLARVEANLNNTVSRIEVSMKGATGEISENMKALVGIVQNIDKILAVDNEKHHNYSKRVDGHEEDIKELTTNGIVWERPQT